MLGMSAFLIMGGMRQLVMTHELRTSINQKQKEKKALSSKKKELEKAKQNLTNPDYVEYIARGKYLVTKEGEQVFKFQVKTTRPLRSSFLCKIKKCRSTFHIYMVRPMRFERTRALLTTPSK